jgi:hypothetical protein
MASGGGCPLGYDKAAAGSAEQHAAQAARRVEAARWVEGLIFDVVEHVYTYTFKTYIISRCKTHRRQAKGHPSVDSSSVCV